MTRAELEQKVDNFVNTYLGQSNIGFNIPGQCVALCNQYWLDLWGIRFPLQGAGTAYEILSIANNTRPDLFVKVTNNPNDLNQLPSKGDVMIWKNLAGGAGHCAIYLSKGSGVFTSLDQNWVANKVTKETHDWSNVAGWIHNLTTEVVTPPVDPCADVKKQLTDANSKITTLNTQTTTLTKQLSDDAIQYKKQLDYKQKELDTVTDNNISIQSLLSTCQIDLANCHNFDEQTTVQNWFVKLWNRLFQKGS